MKYIIIACTFFSFSAAAAILEESRADTANYENTNDGKGNYRYSFKTSNGISREEVGYLVNVGENDEHIVVEGSYSYTDPDGKVIVVNYTADENGYRIVDPNNMDRVPSIILESALPGNVVASLLGK